MLYSHLLHGINCKFLYMKRSITRLALGKQCLTILRILSDKSKVTSSTSSRFFSSISSSTLQTSKDFVPAIIAIRHPSPTVSVPYWLLSCRARHWTRMFHLLLCSCRYYSQIEATSVHEPTVPMTCNHLIFPYTVSQNYVH